MVLLPTCYQQPMPSIIKHRDKWRATVSINGARKSRSFRLKSEAQQWAYEAEQSLRLSAGGKGHTVADLFERYATTESPKKKGARWEQIRLRNLATALGHIPLPELSADDIARWRDERLKDIQGESVRREMSLLSAVFETARREWKWISHNPIKDVKRPPSGKPRHQRFTDEQIEALCDEMALGGRLVSSRVAAAFLFAIETAMRASEIAGLTAENVKGRVAHLPETKNGEARAVPLSSKALEVWSHYPNGFDLTPMQISSHFKRAKDKLGFDVTFHDSRREATSRLSKKLEVLELARVTGHKNIRQLLTYYQTDAEGLADKLD